MNRLINKIQKHRKLLIIFADITIVFFSTLFASLLLYTSYVNIFLKTSVIQLIIYVAIFVMFNMYNKLWRCANVWDISMCCAVSLLAGLIYNAYLLSIYDVSLSYLISNVIVATFSLCTYRIIYKFVRQSIIFTESNKIVKHNFNNSSENTLIISKEKNLDKLALQLTMLNKNNFNIKGIVSDSSFIKGTTVNGIKVLGLMLDIEVLCKEHSINKILLHDDCLSDKHLIKVLNNILKQTNIKIYKFNNIENINNINKSSVVIKEVSITDLLGRDTVNLKIDNIDFIKNKTILVTGGGGSIGSELCRQIAGYTPKQLIILDNYENNAYAIQGELIRTLGNNLPIQVEIASVQDSKKIEKIFRTYRPNLVFHAAAHKHVPLMEHNPEEAIKNNVFGTLNVVKMADKYSVEKFVLISTDKAVNPTNIMGATKRITEMIIQYYSVFSCTNFAAVRFGNVLGSNGSVIPLFKKQIESGGPVTVTHPNVVRYFMTIYEAVGLILQAGEMAKGGEIFVLDMGNPVKIKDLAENMISLSGLTLGKDIDIEYVGLRPGEKLYEELLMAGEGLQKTENSKIYIGKPIDFDMKQFINNLEKLKELAITNNSNEIFSFMTSIVNTYKNNDLLNKDISYIQEKAM